MANNFKAPTVILSANSKDFDNTHQKSPSWVVAFASYENPSSLYSYTTKEKKANSFGMKNGRGFQVVDNDCIQVQITNNKSSFGKHCSLTMRVGAQYYSNSVAPGDWVFVWMANYQDDVDNIIKLISQSNPTNDGGKLNNWDSGLKFIGRVIVVNSMQSVSSNGNITLIQTIECQAFLEFASTVFHTNMSSLIAGAILNPIPPNSNSKDAKAQQAAAEKESAKRNYLISEVLLSEKIPGLQEKMIKFFNSKKAFASPDEMIAIYYALVFAVSKDKLNNNPNGDKIRATFSDAMRAPPQLKTVLNIGTQGDSQGILLWQCYKIYLGIQQYFTDKSTNSGRNLQNPWEKFAPTISKDASPPFYFTPNRCTGKITYSPPPWDGRSAWNFLSMYVNDPINEMFTSLRCGRDNKITPTMTVREQPFGTNLFWYLPIGKAEVINEKRNKKTNASVITNQNQNTPAQTKNVNVNASTQNQVKPTGKKSDAPTYKRALYANLPRWIIDESIVNSISVSTSEVNRVNMVQVFATFAGSPLATAADDKANKDAYRNASFAGGNFVVDDPDIRRNGLRMKILELPFGDFENSIGITQHWARLKADHYFNGHLKPFGTITLEGIQEPICEGDNIQFRDVVYHIDNVQHVGSLSANGMKQFKTVLGISNGILADALDSPEPLPAYQFDRNTSDRLSHEELPGMTYENTSTSSKS